jgi:5-formyltetrahydrofolate cyclo-ligase
MSGKTLDSDAQKAELRAHLRRVRSAIPAGERARLAELAEEALFGLPEVATAHTVLLFYAFGTEVPTAGMAERVLRSGKRLLLPYLEEEGMEAAEVQPGEALAPSGYGPREPHRRVPVDPTAVDLVVTPGLGFDRAGRRLGWGGGHYDRYLARLRPRAVRVGVGFSVQVVEEVPTGPEDQHVDLLVTDAGVIDCRPPEHPGA